MEGQRRRAVCSMIRKLTSILRIGGISEGVFIVNFGGRYLGTYQLSAIGRTFRASLRSAWCLLWSALRNVSMLSVRWEDLGAAPTIYGDERDHVYNRATCFVWNGRTGRQVCLIKRTRPKQAIRTSFQSVLQKLFSQRAIQQRPKHIHCALATFSSTDLLSWGRTNTP